MTIDAPPPRIRVNPTNRRVYACRHCDRTIVPGEPDLPLAVIYGALSEIRARFGPREINIAGGEPLLYGGLLDLVAHAREEGHWVNLVTNGALLAPRLARDLGRWGLNQCVVSLDGFQPEHDALREPGAFARATTAMDALRRQAPGVGLAVICVIQRLDASILRDFAEWVLAMQDVQALTFQAFISHRAHEKERGWYLAHPLWPDDLPALNGQLDALAALAAREPRLVTSPVQFGLMKRYFADPTQFVLRQCLSWKQILTIEGNGDVKYCQGRGAIGNLNGASFSAIWDSPAHRELRSRLAECRIVCHYVVNCGLSPESLAP